jgi:hypothetical protein
LSKNENILPIAESVTFVPVEMRLNVDAEFEAFVKSKAQKQEVEPNKLLFVIILKHKIPFKVKCCAPEHSIIGKETKLTILNVDTRTDMALKETGLNIFMTDERVRKVLCEWVVEERLTEDNAVKLWKELKKQQLEKLSLVPDLSKTNGEKKP